MKKRLLIWVPFLSLLFCCACVDDSMIMEVSSPTPFLTDSISQSERKTDSAPISDSSNTAPASYPLLIETSDGNNIYLMEQYIGTNAGRLEDPVILKIAVPEALGKLTANALSPEGYNITIHFGSIHAFDDYASFYEYVTVSREVPMVRSVERKDAGNYTPEHAPADTQEGWYRFVKVDWADTGIEYHYNYYIWISDSLVFAATLLADDYKPEEYRQILEPILDSIVIAGR